MGLNEEYFAVEVIELKRCSEEKIHRRNMPVLTVTPVGYSGNKKVLLQTSDELKQMISNHVALKPRESDYKTPQSDEYITCSCDPRVASMLKLGSEQKLILQVRDYEFTPESDSVLASSVLAGSDILQAVGPIGAIGPIGGTSEPVSIKRGCFVKVVGVLA